MKVAFGVGLAGSLFEEPEFLGHDDGGSVGQGDETEGDLADLLLHGSHRSPRARSETLCTTGNQHVSGSSALVVAFIRKSATATYWMAVKVCRGDLRRRHRVDPVTNSCALRGDIALILIDIDGTLVGTNAAILQSTWQALGEARRRGVHLALCTGRPCSGTAVTYAYEVSPHEPHIFQSGAVVCHPDGRVVYASEFPGESYETQVAMARSSGLAFEVYTATDCFVERHTALTLGHEEAIGLSTVVVPDLLFIEGPVIRVQWIVPWDIWPPYEAAIRADKRLEVSVARHPDLPQACFTSVTARGISKASAAATLAQHYGLNLSETAMIGDGDNDIGVLGVVGLPIAMGNATDAVKAVAAHIVGDVDEGGFTEAVAYALAFRR